MQTAESFCNIIFDMSYSTTQRTIVKDNYKQFYIPKKNGVRVITHLPKEDPLSELQYKLLANFQSHPLPLSAKGFVRGESYISYLSPHVGSNYFLRLDIKDFFNSLTKTHVHNSLTELFSFRNTSEETKVLNLVWDIVSYQDHIPQGVPTSPMLSNLIMARIDQRILKYCQIFDVNYTRYADDLLFSSSKFDFTTKHWFTKKIKYILHSVALSINYSKTKISKNEISLNGYIISKQGLRLSRTRLSDLRHIISACESTLHTGQPASCSTLTETLNTLPLKHRDLKSNPFQNLFQIIQYLCGYRAFLLSWLDNDVIDSLFKRRLLKLINKTEQCIRKLSNL